MSLISESLKRAHDDRSQAESRPAFNLVDSQPSAVSENPSIFRLSLWIAIPTLALAGLVTFVFNTQDTKQVARVTPHQVSAPASSSEASPVNSISKKPVPVVVNPSQPERVEVKKPEPAKKPTKKKAVSLSSVAPKKIEKKPVPTVKPPRKNRVSKNSKALGKPEKKMGKVKVSLTPKKTPVKKAVVASLPNKNSSAAKNAKQSSESNVNKKKTGELGTQAPAEKDSEFFFKMGVFYQRTKDPIEALDYYNKALQLDPTNAEIYNNRSLIYKELGKFDKAVTGFLKAIHFDPKYVKAYNNIGLIYFLKDNPAAAIASFQKAIEIDPGNLESYNNLASVYKKQDNPFKARELYQSILRMNPGQIEAHYNLALLYEQEGDYPNAITHYSRFVELGASLRPKLASKVKAHLKLLQ